MLKKNYLLALCFFSTITAFSQSTMDANAPEKKVDYLEKIYFSGKNKADLTDIIQLYVQKMGSQFDTTKLPSIPFLKQYVFLNGILPQLPNTKNSCDVLDIIAAGIRNLDMEEALAQKIKQPSAEAVKNSADALGNINKVNNAISTTNSALNTLAWGNYLYSGKAIGFGTMGKIGGVTGTLGAGVDALNEGKQIADAVKSLGLIKSKDKACKEVDPKEIALGEHKFTPVTPPTTADVQQFNASNAQKSAANPVSIVTITNIQYTQLKTLRTLIQKMQGVTNESDDFNNNTAVLKISHTLELNQLLDNITQLTTAVKLEVISADSKANTGTLVCKL